MAKTKKERRCEIMHEKLREYLDPIVQRAREAFEGRGETFNEGVVNGIIKDRVAFFISEHYGVNFQMVRNYFAPNNLLLHAVKDFVNREIPYKEVKEFFYDNEDLFKQRCNELGDFPNARRVIVRNRGSSKFLRLDEDGVVWTDMIHASGFDVFHTKELTLEFINNKYLSEFQYELDDLDANTIMEGAERWYHVPAL